MSTSTSALMDGILRAFARNTPPPAVCEDSYYDDKLAGRKWYDVHPDKTYLYSDALYTCTPEGYRYFLPAFVIPILSGHPASPGLAHEILRSLSRIQEDPLRWAALNGEQKAAVSCFVEWCVNYHPEYFSEGPFAEKVKLCQTWNPFLPSPRTMIRSPEEADLHSEPAAAIRESIRQTFTDTSLPSRPISVDELMDVAFRLVEGKSFDAAFLLDHQEKLHSLTEEGCRRFLPGYMLICLDDYPQSADLVAVLMEVLSPWPHGVGTPFQNAEREVVARFVRWTLAHRPDPYTDFLSDKRELCEFWNQFLPPGTSMDCLDPQ